MNYNIHLKLYKGKKRQILKGHYDSNLLQLFLTKCFIQYSHFVCILMHITGNHCHLQLRVSNLILLQ